MLQCTPLVLSPQLGTHQTFLQTTRSKTNRGTAEFVQAMGLVGHIGLEGIDDKVSLHKKVGTYLAKSWEDVDIAPQPSSTTYGGGHQWTHPTGGHLPRRRMMDDVIDSHSKVTEKKYPKLTVFQSQYYSSMNSSLFHQIPPKCGKRLKIYRSLKTHLNTSVPIV